MTSSIYIKHIGELEYSVERTDEDDYKTEFISKVVFHNAGKTIFGYTPHWQVIEFGDSSSIDELLMALSYVKSMQTDQFHLDHEGIAYAIRRCNNMCAAIKDEAGWKCKWCGETTTGKYAEDGKPKRCSECGAYFNEYKEDDDE